MLSIIITLTCPNWSRLLVIPCRLRLHGCLCQKISWNHSPRRNCSKYRQNSFKYYSLLTSIMMTFYDIMRIITVQKSQKLGRAQRKSINRPLEMKFKSTFINIKYYKKDYRLQVQTARIKVSEANFLQDLTIERCCTGMNSLHMKYNYTLLFFFK